MWTFLSCLRRLPDLFRNSQTPQRPERSWKELVESKKQKIDEKIPSEWRLTPEVIEEGQWLKNLVVYLEDLLDARTIEITSYEIDHLVDLLSKGELTAVQVAEAFCKRAVYAHQLIPFLMDFDYDLAVAQARELDEYFEKHRRLKGPLHGLPVSLKDQFHVKGLETTMGYVGWIGTFEGCQNDERYLKFDSRLIAQLRELGAVPYAKTSLVQTLRSGETNNNILGYLWNPVNARLTSGGSSGGEGVMAAFKGSAIGFGTDSGGSVSMPAAYCGCFSLKPSFQRFSFEGVPTNAPGQTLIPTVPGILGPSLATLRRVAKSVISAEPWRTDASVVPLPWRDDVEAFVKKSQLSIGLFRDDGVVMPHPPMLRALQMTENALQKFGHKTLQWYPPSHMNSVAIRKPITHADGMPSIVENIQISGEPFVPEVVGQFPNDGKASIMPLQEFEKFAVKLEAFRQAYHVYWESTEQVTGTGRPVDAVIFPVGPHAANLPGQAYWWTYTSIVNVLDYCAVVVPVTHVDVGIDRAHLRYEPRNEKDYLNWKAYEPEVFDGAPVGIMIVGRRFEEEKVLAVAGVVMQALKASSENPQP